MASNGNKKHGRNKIKCNAYRVNGTKAKNDSLRAQRHAARRERFAARKATS